MTRENVPTLAAEESLLKQVSFLRSFRMLKSSHIQEISSLARNVYRLSDIS